MFRSAHRFSGELSWLMSQLPPTDWTFLGCVNFEDRSLSAWEILSLNNLIENTVFFEINDLGEPNEPWLIEGKTRTTLNIQKIRETNPAGIGLEFIETDLNLRLEGIESCLEATIFYESKKNIILDITAFPKMFFLPILHFLLLKENIRNLIVINSQPQRYGSGILAEKSQPWKTIRPFFPVGMEDEKTELIIVSVGFMPLGLRDVSEFQTSIKYLFPFPPGQPNYRKNWLFLNDINKHGPPINDDDILRVDASDTSRAFDLIRKHTSKGHKKAIFAPFGPKPLSLAMGLFASRCFRTDREVKHPSIYYTQPTIYNPDYSSGFKKAKAYCIKLEGKELYKISE